MERERLYHRSHIPLGTARVPYRAGPAQLPAAIVSDPNFRFGAPSYRSASAKELINPHLEADDSPAARALYARSHNHTLPSEQRERINWAEAAAPRDHRFGKTVNFFRDGRLAARTLVWHPDHNRCVMTIVKTWTNMVDSSPFCACGQRRSPSAACDSAFGIDSRSAAA